MPEGDLTATTWLETGVPQLDQILGGGLLRGSLVMVIGQPGTGKTMLAQQMAFHQADQGRAVLLLSGYSETHDKLLSHTRRLGFFKPGLIGNEIQLLSLLDLLQAGPDETRNAIARLVHARRLSLVVIDGFAGMARLLGSDVTVQHFLYMLGGQLAVLGITTLVLVEGEPEEPALYPELSLCDVILALRQQQRGSRSRRLLEVRKARGSDALEGVHPFRITNDGVTIFPRWESAAHIRTDAAWSGGRAGFGVPGVDRMLCGGPNVGTVTLAAGSPGVGKTLLGLHFAAEGVRLREPVLVVSFVETIAQIREQARVFGLDLASAEAAGVLRLLTLPAHDLEADQVVQLISADVEQRQTQRLVIDSMAELDRGIGDRERRPGFLSALVDYLHGEHVTTYATIDLHNIAGPALELTDVPLSLTADNLLLLRTVEYRAELHRVFSVLKMRFSPHERAIYEYSIDDGQGIRLLGPAPLSEGLLTGIARSLGHIAYEQGRPSATTGE